MTPGAATRHPAWRDPLDAFAALSGDPYALLLLDGMAGKALIFVYPEAIFSGSGAESFATVREAWRETRPLRLAGLLGYDLAGAFERLPQLGGDWPDLALAAYPAWALFDRKTGTVTVEAVDDRSADRLVEALERPVPPRGPAPAATVRPAWSREQYEAAAAKARDYVHAGDVFQVNLSQRFDAELAPGAEPYDLFRSLAERSPAPFAAYLRLDADHAVVTNSPERFLTLDAGGHAVSEPIKGTAARAGDPRIDQARIAALKASEKDRAENLMIVDLMRHDLARVCRPGSVRAPRLCEVESYANVHHLVSKVTGDLAEGRDAFDLLAAAFPPGSITGAPKVRAMEIIAELEGEARGPYCGAIGWIGADGAMDMNVMIRTLALTRIGADWRAALRSGGGVVADSEPALEYEETLAKASALRAALEETA
jgi:para-aminobenzoate synthetase component 1